MVEPEDVELWRFPDDEDPWLGAHGQLHVVLNERMRMDFGGWWRPASPLGPA